MEAVTRFAAAVLAQLRAHTLVPLEQLRAEREARNADIRRGNKQLRAVCEQCDQYHQQAWDSVHSVMDLQGRLTVAVKDARLAERERNAAVADVGRLTDAAELARLREREKLLSKASFEAQETLRRVLAAFVGVTSVERVPVGEVLVLHTSDAEAGMAAATGLRDEFGVPVVVLDGDDDLTGLDEDMMRERGWLKVASLEGQILDDLRVATANYFGADARPEGTLTLDLKELYGANRDRVDQGIDTKLDGSQT